MANKRSSIFYGWIIVAIGGLVLGLTHGIVSNCFSIYLIPVTEDLGFRRDSFSICHMLINILHMLLSLFSGQFYKRISLRTSMRVSAIVLPLSYFGFSLCSSLPAFYLCAVLVGISYPLLAFLPFTQILSNWFEEKRGTAIGICFMGSGLGGMVMNAVATSLISSIGWRGAFRISSIIMLIGLVPCIYFFIRIRPEEMGLRPYGASEAFASAAGRQPEYGPTFRDATARPGFYLCVLAALIIGFNSTILSQLIIPQLRDLGFDAAHASRALSAYLGVLSVCKILLGNMSDRIGAIKSTLAAVAALGIGLIGLLLGAFPAAHIAIVAGASLGCASSTVSYPILTRYAFGSRSYVGLYGIINAASSLAAAFALVIANALFALTSSYSLILYISIGLTLLCAASLFFVKKEPEPAMGDASVR